MADIKPQYAGDTQQRYKARDIPAQAAVRAGAALPKKRSEASWLSRHVSRKVPDCYFCSWMFLASTPRVQIRLYAEKQD